MEKIPKPAQRTRNADAFAQAPVIKPAAQKTRARYTALQQSLLDRGIPIRMVRYITQHFHAKAKIDAFIELYHRGCHLTGKTFSDRYDPKDPKPDACVPRKDGTLVCLPIYLLSQEGSIPDALLLAAARALVSHATQRPARRPTPAPQPAQPKHPTPEPQNDTASLFGMGPASADHSSHHRDSAGQQHTAGPSNVRVRWEWCDDTNSMVSSPVEPVHHTQ